jgi:glutathione S-transferase
MSGGMTRLRPGDATGIYKSYLRRLSHMLDGQAFLLGGTPCVADFAAYHPVWFTRQVVPVMAGILDATPAVLAWMDRMAALGHGASEKWSAEQAIALANSSTPVALSASDVFQDDHGIPLGSAVTIAAETFGQEATQGILLAATRTRYTLRREDPRAGTVHVHFPRIGYVLRAVTA